MVLILPHNCKSSHLQRVIQKITHTCQICTKDIPKTECASTRKEVQYKGICPCEDWQVDITNMPKTIGNLKFLLCFVDMFSGLVEAYPTRAEKASDVAKLLIK